MELPITCKSLLLQVLSQGPGYGREIAERVRAESGGVVAVYEGSLYPSLRRLEHEGLAVVKTQKNTRGGGRDKRVYTLTKKGHELAVSQRDVVARFFALKK